MANLKRRHAFRRWAPDIGENRDLPEPALYLELAVGLTAEQLSGFAEAIAQPIEPLPPLAEGLEGEALVEALRARAAANKAALREQMVAGLGPYVRVVGGPHTVDGLPVGDFNQYLALVQESNDYGAGAIKDVIAALRSFNSFTGADELFSRRRSGGLGSTAAPSVVKDEPKTGGP